MGIESNTDWMACADTDLHAASTQCRSSLIISDWRMVMSQSYYNNHCRMFKIAHHNLIMKIYDYSDLVIYKVKFISLRNTFMKG